MSVWHNPRNVLAESSLLEKPFVAEHGASVGWNQHVHAAWAAHPRLAFMLYLRYPYSPVLQQIERCALNDPGPRSYLSLPVFSRPAYHMASCSMS